MGALGVGVQVSQLPGPDPAAFETGLEVLTADPDGKPQGRQLPFSDHPVDHGRVEIEVSGRRVRVQPLSVTIHRSGSVSSAHPRR